MLILPRSRVTHKWLQKKNLYNELMYSRQPPRKRHCSSSFKKLPNFYIWNPPPLNLPLTPPRISQNSCLNRDRSGKGESQLNSTYTNITKSSMIPQWQWMKRGTIYSEMYLKYWIWFNVAKLNFLSQIDNWARFVFRLLIW